MKRWLRDWWRGWSDADLARVKAKIGYFGDHQPQVFMLITDREMRAFQAYEKCESETSNDG
jgi:hypothetical protein